jgi:hypothetical protein
VLAPCIGPPPLQAPLIGRAEQLELLAKRIQPGANMFLHGNYGVGKTSLARELFNQVSAATPAERGHIWRRLGKTSPEGAIELLARVFQGQQVSKADGLNAKIEAFKTLLANFPGLLIGLDEVPDKKDGRAALDAAAGCAVMMNGTAALKLSGMQNIKIKPLSVDAARERFLSLCQLSASGPSKADLKLIDKICKRMGRFPRGSWRLSSARRATVVAAARDGSRNHFERRGPSPVQGEL